MRPIVYECSMVCLSVTIVSPAKTAELSEIPLVCALRWGQAITHYMGSTSPVKMGNFEREGAAHCKV